MDVHFAAVDDLFHGEDEEGEEGRERKEYRQSHRRICDGRIALDIHVRIEEPHGCEARPEDDEESDEVGMDTHRIRKLIGSMMSINDVCDGMYSIADDPSGSILSVLTVHEE